MFVRFPTISSRFVVLTLHIHGGVEGMEGSSSTESSKKQGTGPTMCFPDVAMYFRMDNEPGSAKPGYSVCVPQSEVARKP